MRTEPKEDYETGDREIVMQRQRVDAIGAKCEGMEA